MLAGVAVVAFSIIVTAILTAVVGGVCEAIMERRWPAEFPPVAVAAVVLSVAAGGLIGSALG